MDWTNRLQVNDCIDVYDKSSTVQSWCYAWITDVNNTSIRVTYHGWDEQFDEYIDKDSERLAPFNTHTIPCTVLKSPSMNVKPSGKYGVVYDKNTEKKYLIIITANMMTLIKYDIASDMFEVPNIPTPNGMHSNVIFANNEIIDIHPQSVHFFHTDSWEWKEKQFESRIFTEDEEVQYLEVKRILYEDNKIYIVYHAYERVPKLQTFDIKTGKSTLINLQKRAFPSIITNGHMIGDDVLMLYCGNKFYLYQLNKDEIEAQEMSVKVNDLTFGDSRAVRPIVIYEYLYLVIDGSGYHIFDKISNKWFSSPKKTMPGYTNCIVFDAKDNYLHFMGGNINGNFHLSIDMFQLIPNQLIKQYKSKNGLYHKLIYGFVNQNVDAFNMVNKYSHHLTSIILLYFPVFLYN